MNNAILMLHRPGEFEYSKNQLPDLGPGDVLIEFKYCGICGSDVSTFNGFREGGYPKSLGHEFVATVKKVGPAVTGIKKDETVVSDLNFRCLSCEYCLEQKSHLCIHGQTGKFSNRGFAHQAVIDSRYLYKVNGIPKPEHCLIEPLSCVLHAFQQANIKSTESVLIIGAGGLGLCMAILMQHFGTEASVSDINEVRLGKLLNNFPVLKADNSNKLFDVSIDLSGEYSGLEEGLKRVRKGGKLITMSHLDGQHVGDNLLSLLTRNDIAFKVSYLNGSVENINLAIKIVSELSNNSLEQVLKIRPVNQINDCFKSRKVSHFNKDILELSFI